MSDSAATPIVQGNQKTTSSPWSYISIFLIFSLSFLLPLGTASAQDQCSLGLGSFTFDMATGVYSLDAQTSCYKCSHNNPPMDCADCDQRVCYEISQYNMDGSGAVLIYMDNPSTGAPHGSLGDWWPISPGDICPDGEGGDVSCRDEKGSHSIGIKFEHSPTCLSPEPYYSAEVIGAVTIDHMPRMSASLVENDPPGSYTLRVNHAFPQAGTNRFLGTKWVDINGDMGDWMIISPLSHSPQSYSHTHMVPPEGAIALKVEANACGDETVTEYLPISASPNDPSPGDDPFGNPVFGDDGRCDQNPGEKTTFFPSGNATFSEGDPLPGAAGKRTYNSRNDQSGFFGLGWSSVFDSRVEILAGNKVRLIKENGRSVYFKPADTAYGGTVYEQWWPSGRAFGTLKVNAGEYIYTDPSGTITRKYSDPLTAGGHLTSQFDAARQTGFNLTWAAHGPTAVEEINGRWAWVVGCKFEKIREISFIAKTGVPNTTVSFQYSTDDLLLTGTKVDGASVVTYGYSGNGLLDSVIDPLGNTRMTFGYETSDPEHLGWVTSAQSQGNTIDHIDYNFTGTRQLVDGEYAIRVFRDLQGTLYTDYYIRAMFKAPDKTVQIDGVCPCSGTAETTLAAFDPFGRPVREQDGRGFVTVRSFDPWNRVVEEWGGINPLGCTGTEGDPGPEDSPEALAALYLDHTDVPFDYTCALDHRIFQYNSTDWPFRVTRTCRESVVEGHEGQLICNSIELDPETGTPMVSTASGFSVDPRLEDPSGIPEPIFHQARISTTILYDGTEGAAFNPGAVATAVDWAVVSLLPQPAFSIRETNGPLPGNASGDDRTIFVHYPLDSTVPFELRGHLAATMDAEGGVTIFDGYDVFGNVTRVIDVRGSGPDVITETEYDALGRPLTVTLKGQTGCVPDFDPFCAEDIVLKSLSYHQGTGPLESLRTPGDASEARYTYDSWGRLAEIRRGPVNDPQEAIQYSEFHPIWGGVGKEETLGITDGGAWEVTRWSGREYDHLGRLEETVNPGPSGEVYEVYEYDPAGNISTFTDGSHTEPNVEYSYDGLGRLLKVRMLLETDSVSGEVWADTTYGYDSNGKLTTVTDANGIVTIYSVDDFGQTTQIVSPVTGQTDIVYDVAGRKVWQRDATGAVEEPSYNWVGQPVDITTTNGGQYQVTFAYTDGRKTGASSPDSIESWDYDRRGQIVRYIRDGMPLVMQYDRGGSLVFYGRSVGEEGVNYTLDWAGRPIAASFGHPDWPGPKPILLSAGYLPYGPADELLWPSFLMTSVFETSTFDLRYQRTEQIAGVKHRLRENLFYQRTRVFDNVGNLSSIDDDLDPSRSWSFQYDDAGRLRNSSGSWGQILGVSYDLDLVGNRQQRTLTYMSNESLVEDYTYDSFSGLLTGYQETRFGTPGIDLPIVHDAIGNLIDDSRADYGYTPTGSMAWQGFGEYGPRVGFEYDSTGRRITSISDPDGAVPERRDHYLLPDGRPWRVDAADGSSVWPIYLGGRLVGTVRDEPGEDPVPDIVIGDHLGYPEMVIDYWQSTVSWTADHLPFGEIVSEVNPENDPGLRYPGQWSIPEAEALGLPEMFYNMYRWYVPGWGRYSQSDPLEYRYPIPGPIGAATHHLFSYAANSPLHFIDSKGLTIESGEFEHSVDKLKDCSQLFRSLMDTFHNEFQTYEIRWGDTHGRRCTAWTPLIGFTSTITVDPEMNHNCEDVAKCLVHEFYERWLIDYAGWPDSVGGAGDAHNEARRMEGQFPAGDCCKECKF